MPMQGLLSTICHSTANWYTLRRNDRMRFAMAGSVGQLGQRIGTAVGTAVALSLFYATIYREEGQHDGFVVFHDAYAFGMTAVGLFVGLAFLVSILDLTARRKKKGRTPGAA